MADSKLTALTADTAPVDADLVYTVDDVAGTPTSKKVTLANFAGAAPFSSRYGSALKSSITQVAHGLAVQDLVYLNSTTYTKAKADAAGTAEVVGIVSAVADADNFTLLTRGKITGLSGLTAGTVYFLSAATAGLLTATAPTTAGHIWKAVLVADTTTSGYFLNYLGMVVVSDAAPTVAFDDVSRVVVTKTSAYTAAIGDDVIVCDATSGAFTVTLPTAVGFVNTLTIKRSNFGANAVTVDGNGSQTIDGALTYVLTSKECITLVSDNSGWIIT